MTPFVGLSADQLAVADEGTWEAVHSRLYLWAAVARSDGVAGLFGHISAGESLPARLLAETEGERRLTDLAHVAELLHAEAMSSQLGLAALRTWLACRGEEPGTEATEADQRSRRLDSAEDAVHILTVHRAKGMEFPIVYCPYLWDNAPSDRPGAPVMFHDAQDGGRRELDVGEKGDATYKRHLRGAGGAPWRGSPPPLRGPYPGQTPDRRVVGSCKGLSALGSGASAVGQGRQWRRGRRGPEGRAR